MKQHYTHNDQCEAIARALDAGDRSTAATLALDLASYGDAGGVVAPYLAVAPVLRALASHLNGPTGLRPSVNLATLGDLNIREMNDALRAAGVVLRCVGRNGVTARWADGRTADAYAEGPILTWTVRQAVRALMIETYTAEESIAPDATERAS